MSDLDAEIKVRIPISMKTDLSNIAKERQAGTKISDIVREAITQYLQRRTAQPGKIVETHWRVAEDHPES